MRRKLPQLKTVLDAIGIKTATFTAATTDIITSAAHGLKDKDLVVLTTTDTLPAGLSTGTVYIVDQATTDTFKLIVKSIGANVDVTDTGTGTHTWTMHDVGWSVNIENYVNKEITVDSDGGDDAEMTIKFQISHQETEPDFSAAQAVDNQWDYCAVRDREDNSVIEGDTGVAFSAADDHRHFNLETNAAKWFNVIISGYVAGEVTVKIKCSNNV